MDEAARLQVLPTVWFRNTWSWKETVDKPVLQASSRAGASVVALDEPRYGRRYLCCDGLPNVLVTENETNSTAVRQRRARPFKDGINDAVVNGQVEALSTEQTGTSVGALFLRD